MSTDKCVLNKRQIYSPLGLTSAATMPPRCTFVVRSLLIISSRDCREADSRDTSPRHACLGEVWRKIWLHDFAINNNGGSVPVIFISLIRLQRSGLVKFLNKKAKCLQCSLLFFVLVFCFLDNTNKGLVYLFGTATNSTYELSTRTRYRHRV